MTHSEENVLLKRDNADLRIQVMKLKRELQDQQVVFDKIANFINKYSRTTEIRTNVKTSGM